MFSVIALFLAGAVGALIKDILKDNQLVLPNIKGDILTLGFLGSAMIGGFVGWVVDGSFLTAALSGFVGYSAIENLLPKK